MKNQFAAMTTPDTSRLAQAFFLSAVTLVILLALIDPVMAAGDGDSLGDAICSVAGWVINGKLGRGLATTAVLIVGVGATLGKVSWGLAVTVGVGIAVVFNADNLAGKLNAGGTGCSGAA